MAMKRCARCHGKLGLGVRSRNVWNGRWWVHVLYCSTHCEALHELERYDARVKRKSSSDAPTADNHHAENSDHRDCAAADARPRAAIPAITATETARPMVPRLDGER